MTTFVNSLKNKAAGLKCSEPVKIFLVFFALATLFIGSEIVYILNNNPSQILSYYATYHLNRTQAFVQKSNIQQALNHLDKAAGSKLKEVDKEYPNLTLETSMIFPTLPDNPDLINDYLDFLRDFDFDELERGNTNEWANLYYFLGLMAYKHNQSKLVVPFWQTAINFSPEWSYLHVELANYYLTQGEKDRAQSVIESCLQFHFPKKHCKQFMEENVETNSSVPVGFWEKEINDI
jgi:tetratricopeptide (TPR) repeat protein